MKQFFLIIIRDFSGEIKIQQETDLKKVVKKINKYLKYQEKMKYIIDNINKNGRYYLRKKDRDITIFFIS